MRIYYEFLKNAFQSNAAYKFNTFFKGITEFITVLVQISIWTALYKYNNSTDISVNSVSLKDMITYTIVSAGICILTNNSVILLIDEKIKTGEIAMDFIKPINFKLYLLSRTIGDNVYNFLFRFIPLLLVIIPLWGFSIIELKNVPIFLITLINGMLISFLMAYILGVIGFWYLSIWHLDRLLWDATRLLSGSFIPLWFFPEALVNVSNYLPFRLIYFTPISIFLGKISFMGSLQLVIQQILWISILYVLGRFIWSKGINKLVIQGG